MPSKQQTPNIFSLFILFITGLFMKKHSNLFSIKLFIIFILYSFSFSSLSQETREGFIIDEVYIYMHSGAGKNYRIVGTINAGSSVKLTGLVQNKFTQIIDEKDRKNWVESQYISDKAGLRFVTAELNTQLASSTELNTRLKSQLGTVQTSVVKLKDESSQLNNEIATLKNQLASTQAELKSQDVSIQKQWFITGAAVLGIGLLLGLILPKILGRRRSNNDSWK